MKNILFVVLVLLFLLTSVTYAQTDDDTLNTVTEQCMSVGDNSLCFGAGEIEVLTNCETTPDFDSPGDVVPLDSVCSIDLNPTEPQALGVAVMKMQPTDAEAAVTLVLFGDAEVHNASSASAQTPIEVLSDTELRMGPGSQFGVLFPINAGDTVQANACNCTGNWLRVIAEDGTVGWVPSQRTNYQPEAAALPTASQNTPIYATMQALMLRSTPDSDIPTGLLIQVPETLGNVDLQINGVDINLDASALVQVHADNTLTVDVLSGSGRIAVGADAVRTVPAGVRVIVPFDEALQAQPDLGIALYTEADVADIPLGVLPVVVDPFADTIQEPMIVGMDACNVISGVGEMTCPLYFVNPAGEDLTQIQVDFIYAAQGDWEGSVNNDPQVIDGSNTVGTLAWDVSCELGQANFIGPVEWEIIVINAAGQSSQPYHAEFDCVAG